MMILLFVYIRKLCSRSEKAAKGATNVITCVVGSSEPSPADSRTTSANPAHSKDLKMAVSQARFVMKFPSARALSLVKEMGRPWILPATWTVRVAVHESPDQGGRIGHATDHQGED
ncbi:hypothetical protein TrST_g4013 [Triparma strigata]|uniref:Uncharacterized protein n=1 Tax=Triparma strigata TaxID=1606541 RepID=A0A9W7C2V8_9STRA|nr:hypothetical protein TrST_g4013 [Triparma strigata]